MATTLLNLRDRARSRADMEDSSFVSDPELDAWINQGYMELYDIVVSAFEDYFTTSTTFTISSGNTQALPATFYKLRGLDLNNNGKYVNCREFNFADRNDIGNRFAWLSYYAPARSYRIMGDQLIILPEDNASGSYKLWFVPAATLLVNTSDTIPASLSKFGWDEYIVLYAAERMLSKEESGVTDVVRERAEIANRITQMAANRQVDQSETVQDVADWSPYMPGGWWNGY